MRDPVDLDALRALLAAAVSPRPWRNSSGFYCFGGDAKLAVTAVNALPALLDEVTRLRAVAAAARAAYDAPPGEAWGYAWAALSEALDALDAGTAGGDR